jgi:hypothetical protein
MIIARTPDEIEFEHARRKAFWHEVFAFLTGRSNRLLSWEEVSDSVGAAESTYLGTQRVPVDSIVGSVGRYADFDLAFMPTNDSLASRWRSVARAYDASASLPPVVLYKLDGLYFVVDGHHRVSVARNNGVLSLDAQVIEVKGRIPATGLFNVDALEINREHVRFLEGTALDKLRPDQRIEFTVKGGYARLLEHIAALRRHASVETGQAVTAEQSICQWYDGQYVPLVQIIRTTGILADFPGRTEADLYLWIVEHADYLREQCGPEVMIERVALHFAARHTARWAKRVAHSLRGLFSEPVCDLVQGDNRGDGHDGGASATA